MFDFWSINHTARPLFKDAPYRAVIPNGPAAKYVIQWSGDAIDRYIRQPLIDRTGYPVEFDEGRAPGLYDAYRNDSLAAQGLDENALIDWLAKYEVKPADDGKSVKGGGVLQTVTQKLQRAGYTVKPKDGSSILVVGAVADMVPIYNLISGTGAGHVQARGRDVIVGLPTRGSAERLAEEESYLDSMAASNRRKALPRTRKARIDHAYAMDENMIENLIEEARRAGRQVIDVGFMMDRMEYQDEDFAQAALDDLADEGVLARAGSGYSIVRNRNRPGKSVKSGGVTEEHLAVLGALEGQGGTASLRDILGSPMADFGANNRGMVEKLLGELVGGGMVTRQSGSGLGAVYQITSGGRRDFGRWYNSTLPD